MTDPVTPALDSPSSPFTLRARLAATAQDDPEAVAILAPDRAALTFGALLEQIDEVGAFLEGRGLGRGDRVALLAPPGPETAVAVLAISSWATCIPLDPAALSAEGDAALAATRPRALIAPAGQDAAGDCARRHGLPAFAASPVDGAAGRFRLSGGDGGALRESQPIADDVALVLRTSGSTARPKVVPSTHRNLLARAAKAARLLGLLGSDRCLNPMPLCYGQGLYTGLIAPLAAGGSVICPPTFDQATFLRCVRELSPTWYTAGATHQQAILGWLARAPLGDHGLRFARSGSAPLPATARRELERRLGVPVVEGYGTTETGLVTANPPQGRRRAGSVGVSMDGDVAVVDGRGAIVAPCIDGDVAVRGPTVFGGYEDDAELNRASFRDGWYVTGDRATRDADGYVTLTGRAADVINRGGEKVSPPEVEAALLDHPAVADAVVFPVPHPSLHHEVAAAVTPAPGQVADEADLREFLRRRLAPFKVPRRIAVVAALPRGPTGKPARKDLATVLGLVDAEPAGGRPAALETPMQRTLLRLWREALERDGIGLDDDFFGSGGDSLAAVELLTAIDDELSLRLPLESLVELPTVRELASCLERAAHVDRHALTGGRDVVGVNTSGRSRPVFGICGRMGYVTRLLLVGRELGSEQPFYGLQPPGMDWASVGCETILQMAAHYVARTREVQPTGPYRLLGTSFGGLIAFEMALALQRAGEEVEFLGLVDTEPPACRWEALDNSDPVTLDATALAELEPVPPAIEPQATRVAEAHLRARGAYVLAEPFTGELTYLYCAGEAVPAAGDRRGLWRMATTGGFRLLRLPGLHGRFDREPQFSALCRNLDRCLSGQAQPGLDPGAVFERRYRLTREGDDSESIRSDDGVELRLEPGAMLGRVRAVERTRGRLVIRGWASERDRGRPAAAVVAFVDGHYAGCAACGAPRRRLERTQSAPGLRYAGFRMRLPAPAGAGGSPRVRVVALSEAGRAAELRPSRP